MAIDTIKFSEFANGGDLQNADTTVGLYGGANAYFNNPWTFLPDGTTAERPVVPDSAINYRLRFNTTLLSYEFYNASTSTWQQVEDSGDIAGLIADLASHAAGKGASMIGLQDQTGVLSKTVQDLANASLIAQTSNGTLTNGQFLSDLSSGALKSATGVLSISAALTSIDGLTTSADKMIYTTASNTYAVTALTALARTLLADATAADMATTLEVLPLSGGTMTGVIDMGSHKITSVTDPTLAQDAATKNYVDTTLSGGYLPLSGGTMAGNISMASTYKITNAIDPSSAQDYATKNYVDMVATGLNVQAACICATTVDVNGTYANGAAGVGATLTNAGALAAFSCDGISPSLNDRILVKNQSTTYENGIYTLTTVGDGSTAWVLTRATDYDQPAEVQVGDWVAIVEGSTYASSSWLQTATVTTIGTDPITFIQFSASIPVSVGNGGTGRTSDTAYALIAGGTTSTSAQQSLGTNWVASTAAYPGTAGTSGTLLQSNGTDFVNTTATYPGTATTSGTILRADGTNWVASTATYPNSAGTSGTVLQSNGTNIVNSTAAYPVTATGTGTILRADGTNWVATTATYPTTTTANEILYSSSNNVVAGLSYSNLAINANLVKTVKTQVFTSSGTYTPSTGMLYCYVTLIGGGAGGGSCANTAAGHIASAGGGGAAGTAYKLFTAANIGASATVTIGNAGNGGSSGGANAGSDGNDSSFAPAGTGSTLTASKGTGGSAGNDSTTAIYSGPGSGGSATNGDINISGSNGGAGFGVFGQAFFEGWGGGSSISPITGTKPTSGAGLNGTGYGAGGSGAKLDQSSSSVAGGNGIAGFCQIIEYCNQ